MEIGDRYRKPLGRPLIPFPLLPQNPGPRGPMIHSVYSYPPPRLIPSNPRGYWAPEISITPDRRTSSETRGPRSSSTSTIPTTHAINRVRSGQVLAPKHKASGPVLNCGGFPSSLYSDQVLPRTSPPHPTIAPFHKDHGSKFLLKSVPGSRR
jgi:hypothetical protein